MRVEILNVLAHLKAALKVSSILYLSDIPLNLPRRLNWAKINTQDYGSVQQKISPNEIWSEIANHQLKDISHLNF